MAFSGVLRRSGVDVRRDGVAMASITTVAASQHDRTTLHVCTDVALSSPLSKLVKEILLRLPDDYVVQFKLASKQWHRFIESEIFTREYSFCKNMDRRPKIRLVGKGTGGSGFSFATIKKLLENSPSKGTWLDAKLVCPKPCHGMNLISTEMEDYLYNPSTGYRYVHGTRGALVHMPRITGDRFAQEDHAFTVDNKNEHVIVEIFYQWKNFKTRRTHDIEQPPLPVSGMPPAYLAGFLYWMSEPRLSQSNTRAIVSFEIATKTFDVIYAELWPCQSFVIELEEMLCVVLANRFEEEMDIWKLDHGQWDRAYKVYLKGWPGYSLGANGGNLAQWKEPCGRKRRKVAVASPPVLLPEEMMMEVLQWLPVKFIIRFRAVCPSWAVALSSEKFCSLHTAKTKTKSLPPKLFFISRTAGFDSTSVCTSSSSGPVNDQLFTLDNVRGDFIEMTPTPCHGLTLLHDAMALEYYVFNASTRSISRLPPCQTVPFRTAGTHGNITSLRYKLLPVFVNGFLHWLTGTLFASLRPHGAILSFSLTQETFRLVRSPPFEVSGVHLVKLSDKLSMVRDLRRISSMLEIWKLNDIYSSDWSLDHRIDLSEHPDVIKVIGSASSATSRKKVIVATSNRKVIAYDPTSETLETILTIKETHLPYQTAHSALGISLFEESLVPVCKTNEEKALSSPLSKLVKEILLRLPGDYVVQFKLVSKQWHRFIE
uniref:F-box domain-containing protein n=1 Tax=Leersia perrieri TaxID=77586 RepID=A0A0D9WZG6_9ORYZ